MVKDEVVMVKDEGDCDGDDCETVTEHMRHSRSFVSATMSLYLWSHVSFFSSPSLTATANIPTLVHQSPSFTRAMSSKLRDILYIALRTGLRIVYENFGLSRRRRHYFSP
jgi:hypothetical protein